MLDYFEKEYPDSNITIKVKSSTDDYNSDDENNKSNDNSSEELATAYKKNPFGNLDLNLEELSEQFKENIARNIQSSEFSSNFTSKQNHTIQFSTKGDKDLTQLPYSASNPNITVNKMMLLGIKNIIDINNSLQGAVAGSTNNKGFYGIIQKIAESQNNFLSSIDLDNNKEDKKEATILEQARNVINTAIHELNELKKFREKSYVQLVENIIQNVFNKALSEGKPADIIYTATLAYDIVDAVKNPNIKNLEKLEKLVRVNNPMGADALKAFGIALGIGVACFFLAPLVLKGSVSVFLIKFLHSALLSKIAVSAAPAVVMSLASFGLFRATAANFNKVGADAIKDFAKHKKAEDAENSKEIVFEDPKNLGTY